MAMACYPQDKKSSIKNSSFRKDAGLVTRKVEEILSTCKSQGVCCSHTSQVFCGVFFFFSFSLKTDLSVQIKKWKMYTSKPICLIDV